MAVPDVKRVVQTDFIADTAKFNGPAQAMASQARGLQGVMSGLTGTVGLLTAAFATIGGVAALKSLADIHSKAEDTQIALAGMFSALGQSSDFASGMKDAAEAQKAITIAAAKLPGEAEDYIAVFRAGLPSVSAALGGTLKDTYKFTNQLTAITSTLQVGSEQVARDIPRLLAAGAGGAGGHNITWQRLFPFMKQLPGQADITAQKFNAMNQQARGALLQQLVTGKALGAMVDASANTWSSQTGALASNTRMLLREGSGPLFEGMKDGLKYVNDFLYDSEGEMTTFSKTITAVGQLVSGYLVEGFKDAFHWAQQLGVVVMQYGRGIMDSPGIARLIDAAHSLGENGGARGMALGGLAGAAAAGGPAGLIVGPLVNAFSRPGFTESIFAPVLTTFNTATKLLEPFLSILTTLNGIGGDLVEAVLPPVLWAFNSILGPIVNMMSAVWTIGDLMLNALQPSLLGLWQSLGAVATAVGAYLHPVLRLLGAAVGFVYRKLVEQFQPAINLLIQGFTWVFNFLAKWLGKEAVNLTKFADMILGPEENDKFGTNFFDDIGSKIKQAMEKNQSAADAAKAASRNAPAERGGGKTVQDFRGSRFDITQKFAEGYDPDRIAVAFAKDVGSIGEHKLQSGYEPGFGGR